MRIEVDGAPGTIRTCDTRIRNPFFANTFNNAQ